MQIDAHDHLQLADLLAESRAVVPGEGSVQLELSLQLMTLADQLGPRARLPRRKAGPESASGKQPGGIPQQ